MSLIVLKPLRQSELGLFDACRLAGRETGRQRGLNIDGHLVQQVLRPGEATAIDVWSHWHDGVHPHEDQRTIRRQQKNWRLTGVKVEGGRFATVEPGDPVIMLFEQEGDGWHLTWDVVQKGLHNAGIRHFCEQLLDGQSSRLLSPGEAGALLERAAGVVPAFTRSPRPQPPAAPSPPARDKPPGQIASGAERPKVRDTVPAGPPRVIEDTEDEAIPPNNAHLVHALRSIGYRMEQAIADLIDNSIQAEARHVLVRLVVSDDELVRVIVVDDGAGMNVGRLREALRFGSDTEHPGSSLSKFGMGLKLASLSQCRALTVVTNDGAAICARRWTVQGLESGWRSNGLPRKETEALVNTELSRVAGWRHHGTMIVWSDIDRQSATSGDSARVIKDLRKQLSLHLGLHFHRFLEAGQNGQMSLIRTGAAPLTIVVETQEEGESETNLSEQVEPRDPFRYPRSGHSEYPRDFVANLGVAGPLTLRAHIWPPRLQLPSYHLDGAQKRQGFYVYRNHRLIHAGGWLRVRQTMDPHLSLARVAIDLPPALDHIFNLDIRKVNITEPPGFVDAVLAASDGTVKFDEYLRAAERVCRQREGDTTSGLPVVPGAGLPKPIRGFFQKEYGTDLDRFYEISFEWADIDEELYFEFHRGESIVYLNRRWRKATLGGRNASPTDAALMKTALFLMLEPLFHLGKESRRWREKAAQINRALVRSARYLDRS